MNSEIYAERIEAMLEEPIGGEARSTLANPDQWFIDFATGGSPAASGVAVNQATAMSISAVFACVRNLAEDVAKLPIFVGRRLPGGGKERLPAHPLYRLLETEPNPEMTAFDFRQAITACATFLGNGYAEIETANGGTPIALWPLENWRVKVRRGPDKRLYYEIDGGKSRLELANMLHIKGYGNNGVLGEMLLHCGRESMGLTIAAQRFASSFFGNGTQMAGVLEYSKTLKGQAMETLRRQWMEMHSGPDNAHKPAILEDGMKWTKTSAEPNEAQMIETRMFQVEDVARWFRMPPHKIGHLERAQGWSTLESANTDYVVDTLMPWLTRWEQESKRKLVADKDPTIFAEHMVQALLRGDSEKRALLYTALRNAGAINANYLCEQENIDPPPGDAGTVYLVPANMMNIEKAAKMDGSADDPTLPKPPPAPVIVPAASADPAIPAAKPVASSEKRELEIAEAHRPALMDAAGRVVRRGMQIFGKLGMTREAIDKLFTEHVEYARKAFSPALQALNGTRAAMNIPAFNRAQDWATGLDALQGELREAADKGTAEIVMARWMKDWPGQVVETILEEVM